jgi:hypothetical protein
MSGRKAAAAEKERLDPHGLAGDLRPDADQLGTPRIVPGCALEVQDARQDAVANPSR